MTDHQLAYRPEIDGLRAVAVLPVILFHAGQPHFSGGFAGVDVFFVISGYLIASILLRQTTDGNFSFRSFYERRARRILPALFVMTIATIPFAWMWLLPIQLSKYSLDLIGVGLFISNILFWQRTNYFEPLAEENPLLHTWSLAVEEQFYILFPILLLLVLRYRKQWLLPLVLLAMTLSLGLAEWGWRAAHVANFYLIPTRAWELGAGVACAIIMTKGTLKPNLLLAAVGLIAVITSFFVFTEHTPWPSIFTMLPVAGTALLILFARGNIVAALLALRPLKFVGQISYSVYLWHLPIIAFMHAQTAGTPGPFPLTVMGLMALPLGYLSWRFVENPFRVPQGAAGHISTKKLVVVLFAGLGILFTAFAAGRLTDGGKLRFADEDQPFLYFMERRKYMGYLSYKFNRLLLNEFEDDSLKVLLLGDSFSKDMYNVLRENDFTKGMSISTFMVQKQCGNLLIEQDINALREPRYRPGCGVDENLHNAALQERMKQADYIILASLWQDWQVPYLPESMANISALTDAKLLLFTPKNFERLKAYQLAGYDIDTRGSLRFPIDVRHRNRVTAMLALGLPIIDQSGIICEGNVDCRLFTDEGAAISYDGRHLTPAGAKWIGQRLYEQAPAFKEMVDHARRFEQARVPDAINGAVSADLVPSDD